MRVLSLFDFTGNMVRPWAEAGHECRIVDIQHEGYHRAVDGIWRIGKDVRDVEDLVTAPDIVFAFPPCTDLAISGARWFRDKGMRRLINALELVECARHLCEDVYQAPFLIENPVGMLSTYWREPDYTFDPCDFGGYPGGENDDYTKRTHLWTGHGFRMPPRRPIEPVRGSAMHRLPPGPERANLRSATPQGFARAVFEANKPGAELEPYSPPTDPGSLFEHTG